MRVAWAMGVVGEGCAGYGRRIRSGRRARRRREHGDGGRRHTRLRRVAPRGRRAVAGPAPAPPVRTGGGLDAGAAPSELVRPPRLRRRGPGLSWSRRLGWDVHAVRRRGPRRCGDHRMGGRAPVQRRPGGDVRLLVPGVGAAVRRGAAPAVAAGHRGDDVLSRPLRRLDVRGRLPTAPVRRILERATRRPGASARPGSLRRRVVAGQRGARRRPTALVHRMAGAPQRRCVLGRAPAGPLHDRRSRLHRPRLLRRLLVGHGPDHRRPRRGGGVRTVDPHALGIPPRRRGAGRRGESGDRLRTPRRLLRPGVRPRAATES